MHRRGLTYFAQNLNLFNSRVETAIRTIVSLYSTCTPYTVSLLTQSHFIWLNMLLHNRLQQKMFLGTQRDGPGGVAFINMAGSHRTSMFRPLSDLSLIWFVHSCYCRESADPSDQFELVLAADIWKVVSGVYDTDKSRKSASLARCRSTLTTVLLWCKRRGLCTFPSATRTEGTPHPG